MKAGDILCSETTGARIPIAAVKGRCPIPIRRWSLVLLVGLEPTKSRDHMNLNHACLPISPQKHIKRNALGASSGNRNRTYCLASSRTNRYTIPAYIGLRSQYSRTLPYYFISCGVITSVNIASRCTPVYTRLWSGTFRRFSTLLFSFCCLILRILDCGCQVFFIQHFKVNKVLRSVVSGST